MTKLAPVIGQWYRRPGGESFEVVAIDRDDRTIEIQYFDGTIEELDSEAWIEMPIEEAEAPEDWTGSVDVDDEEKGEMADQPTEHWATPLEYLDKQE